MSTVRRYVLMSALALFVMGGVNLAFYLVAIEARAWAHHSRLVQVTARRARAISLDRQTAVLAFLLTRDSLTLAPEAEARAALPRLIDSLRVLTADNPEQQERVRGIAAAARTWDSAFAGPGSRRETWMDPVMSAAQFRALQDRFLDFLRNEDVVYAARAERESAIGPVTAFAVLIPIATLAVILIALSRRLRDQAVLVDEQQQRIARQSQQGEESAALLTAALESSPIGFGFLDLELRYLRVNPALAALHGVAAVAHFGKLTSDVIPEIAVLIAPYLQQLLITGQPVSGVEFSSEPTAANPRGRRWLENFYPIRKESGEMIGVGVTVMDVTGQRELEDRFRQSEKMEAVGRLAGGVAHDFNNLLTVIRSYTDLLLIDVPPAAPHHDELQAIASAADQAATLARQLLTFSRRPGILPKVLDINTLVTATEPLLRRVISTNVALELQCGADAGPITADETTLEQVLMGLAINASDAMPGGGTLTITTDASSVDTEFAMTRRGVAPGRYSRIRVRDSGTGMDRETLARIFDPFFSTKGPGMGTGLGLTTVYEIIQQLHGFIEVQSEVGNGSVFSIYLPIAGEMTREHAAVATAALAREPLSVSHETVLLVEDEDLVRGTIARILRRQGYQVLTAEHGGEGIRVASEHAGPIDVIITDVMMPEMSGLEFVDRIAVSRPAARILFMSGYSDDDVLIKEVGSRPHAFIQKPFAVEDLTRKVRELLHPESAQ